MNIILSAVSVFLAFYGIILLKLIDLGMPRRNAIYHAAFFPFRIIKMHCEKFMENIDKGLIKALPILYYPIVYFPNAIIGYCEMYLKRDAFFIALIETLDELEEKERNELISILVEKGILVEVKREVKKSTLIPSSLISQMGKEYVQKLRKAY